jgi:hypothetical protein
MRRVSDPIQATIEYIDNYSFYTPDGQPRWQHTAVDEDVWDRLTNEEKREIISLIYNKENGGEAASPFLSNQSAPSQNFTKTIQSTCNYTVGTNETLLNARRACFLEARRSAMEKAGVYMESFTRSQNYDDLVNRQSNNRQVVRDEVQTYTAGVIRAEIVSEDIKVVNGQVIISMTVGTQIQLDDVRKGFREYIRRTTPIQPLKPIRSRGEGGDAPIMERLKNIIEDAREKGEVIFEKTFSDRDRDKHGNIRAFAWNNQIQVGDMIEVIGRAHGQDKAVYIYRGRDHEPRWKKVKNGYHQGRVEHVPLGKAYYVWVAPDQNSRVTVRISRQIRA